VLFNLASGTPYTPTKVYNEVTLAAVAVEPTGQLNSRYGPWTYQVDAKLGKTVGVKGQNLDLYVWVLNILDRDNINAVYTSSGSATTTNFLNSPDGQAYLATNAGPTARRARRRYQPASRSHASRNSARCRRPPSLGPSRGAWSDATLQRGRLATLPHCSWPPRTRRAPGDGYAQSR
jgi:hypothetical protein